MIYQSKATVKRNLKNFPKCQINIFFEGEQTKNKNNGKAMAQSIQKEISLLTFDE